MELIVFDTEDTGLGAKDEVIQFAGLLLGPTLKIKKVINFYCYTQVPMHAKAKAVTGLDKAKLYSLSSGKYFEDYYYSLDIFRKTELAWVGYNSISYDTRMINNTLLHNGLPDHNFGNPVARVKKDSGVCQLDIMRVVQNENGGRSMPLTTAANSLDYSQQQLEEMYQKLLRLMNLNFTKMEHNALYDAMITWLLLVKYKGVCVDELQ